MMRLVRGLLLTSVDDAEAATHAEYHERALFNSVLGTQRGERPGEMLYWLPLGAGVSKMDLRHPQHGEGQQHGWSIPHGDFWCCVARSEPTRDRPMGALTTLGGTFGGGRWARASRPSRG